MQNTKSLCCKITKLLIIIIFLLPSIKDYGRDKFTNYSSRKFEV